MSVQYIFIDDFYVLLIIFISKIKFILYCFCNEYFSGKKQECCRGEWDFIIEKKVKKKRFDKI